MLLAYGNNILVKPLNQDNKSLGGIIIPDEAKKDDVLKSVVVSVSEDLYEKWNDQKRKYPLDIDTVVTHRFYSGTTVEVYENGEKIKYITLKPEEVLAVNVPDEVV